MKRKTTPIIIIILITGLVFFFASSVEVSSSTIHKQEFKDELENQGIDINDDNFESSENFGFKDIPVDLIIIEEIDDEQPFDEELPEFNDGTDKTIIDEIIDIIIPPESLTLDITRTITFENGETDTELLGSFDLAKKTLDLISQKGTNKSFKNSKIEFEVKIDLGNSIIRVGEMKVATLVNDKIIKEKIYTIDTKSIKIENSLATILLDEILPDSLAPQITGGQVQHTKISKTITSFFFITESGKSFFLDEQAKIYEITVTRDGRQSIITDEKGQSIKIFDTDIPFQISQAWWTTSSERCIRKPRWGGNCTQWTTIVAKHPPIEVGSIRLIDVMSGETILTSNGKKAGFSKCCNQGNFYGLPDPNSSIVTKTFLQRNHSYVIIVNEPTPANFKINVPIGGNPVFAYSCGKTCNFPN